MPRVPPTPLVPLWAAWARLRARETRSVDEDSGLETRERRLSGRLLESSAWRAGRRDGPHRSWWPNGVRREHGVYRDGRRDGEWFFVRPDGSLDAARTGLYRDGARIAGLRGFNEWLGSP